LPRREYITHLAFLSQTSLYADDDMLGIKPLELRFPFEFQKQITSIVKLINRTKDYYAFKIETPSQQYHTEPNKGIVSPQSKCTVQITMQKQETAPQGMPYTDDFIVQSTKVNGDLRAEDITGHVFNKGPGEVDEVNLMILVFEPGEPKGDLKSREDTKVTGLTVVYASSLFFSLFPFLTKCVCCQKKKNKLVESAFSEDKPGIRATWQAEAVPMVSLVKLSN
jgi:hypothetical protein